MRVMVIIKATKSSEAGAMPTEALLAAMGQYNEELVKAGIMLSGEGLQPSSQGKRVAATKGSRAVSDGPFAPVAEIAAGFWLWNVSSMDEAVQWARRCPDPMPGEETHFELRPLYEMEDFGDEMTPELRAKEGQLRAELEEKKGATS